MVTQRDHSVRGLRSQKMTPPPGTLDGNRRCGHGPGPRMTSDTFGGDKTLTKTREEESGRVGSPGVQTYLWDTPDNVLGPEK